MGVKMHENGAMKGLSIGQTARSAGVGVETVRFYERRGLIEPPPRTESGYRQYPEDVVVRLGFIRRAKELGFTLNEIKELLSLRLEPASACEDVRRQADLKIASIEEKIHDLQGMKTALAELVDACQGQGTTSECPILDALDQNISMEE